MPKDYENGKILIIELYHKIFSILLAHNQVVSIQAEGKSGTQYRIGSIYIGRVQNIAANINAAFVEIGKGILTFLPLSEADDAILTNRKADGTIKNGDELFVQVVKAPVKTKLASVSAKLSLAGSYVVIEQNKKASGNIHISSKLPVKCHHLYKDAESLQEIAKRFSVIIRTNAANADDISQIISEADMLSKQMEKLLTIGDKRTCFSCLYQGEPACLAFIKNCYQSEYDEIITDKKEIYEALLADERIKTLPVRYYEDDRLPLYKLYSIETRIQELTAKKVWLKSGAYLIIEPTEALIAIDVNTGKYESKKNPEETYLKINLEAAEAIAAALRARNLSGMILVDFINMKEEAHIKQLTEHMKDLLRRDTVPSYVVDITGLGLMEITRQKKNKSFAEQLQEKTEDTNAAG